MKKDTGVFFFNEEPELQYLPHTVKCKAVHDHLMHGWETRGIQFETKNINYQEDFFIEKEEVASIIEEYSELHDRKYEARSIMVTYYNIRIGNKCIDVIEVNETQNPL